jgi:hypothetical protein
LTDAATNTNTPTSSSTPPAPNNLATTPPYTSAPGPPEPVNHGVDFQNGEFIGSPMKKARASVSGTDEEALRRRIASGLTNNIGEVIGSLSSTDTGDKTVPGDGDFGDSL